jgi:hypothetical protein
LQSEREHWVHEYRALATGLGGAGIWLEKVAIGTRPPVSAAAPPPRDDALGGLLRAIRDMELDDSALAELAEEVSALGRKLPSEIRGGADPYDPADPDQLRAALEDIKELLVTRLLSTEQGS